MPEAHDIGPIEALISIVILLIIGSSALLWIKQLLGGKEIEDAEREPLPAWPIGWTNFLIFICAIITGIFFMQIFVGALFSETIKTADGEFTMGTAILSVCILHIPLLGVFFGLRRAYPLHYSGSLNSKRLSFGQAFPRALVLFVRFVPVIWIASLIWGGIIYLLEVEAPPQPLVTLFAEGGNVLGMILLTLFAVILAPISEELIFRGCFYRFLKSKTNIPFAFLISGVFFSLMHANLATFVPLMVIGILLAYIYEEEGNILIPICFHACFNALSLLITFLLSQTTAV